MNQPTDREVMIQEIRKITGNIIHTYSGDYLESRIADRLLSANFHRTGSSELTGRLMEVLEKAHEDLIRNWKNIVVNHPKDECDTCTFIAEAESAEPVDFEPGDVLCEKGQQPACYHEGGRCPAEAAPEPVAGRMMLDNIESLINKASRPMDWKPGIRDIFSDAFTETRYLWNRLQDIEAELTILRSAPVSQVATGYSREQVRKIIEHFWKMGTPETIEKYLSTLTPEVNP